MRIILSILLCFIVSFGYATNYYVSNSGSDSNNGLTTSTPWNSIDKVNAKFSTFAPGDSILFLRNGVWYGTVRVTKDGNSTNHIIIGAYGSGARPIITGYTALTGWTSLGSNLYSKSVVASGDVNLVTVDGSIAQIGRFPNSNAANGGYLVYSAFGPVTTKGAINTITSTTTPINWIGAEIIIRKKDWVNERDTITAISGNIISYRQPYIGNIYTGIANYGYFYQRSLYTLDQNKEWYYNDTTNTLYMYLTSSPAGRDIYISTLDTGIYVGGYDYIDIENLELRGFNRYGVYSYFATMPTIKNCYVHEMGADGVTWWQSTNATIRNCKISDCLASGGFIRNDGSGGYTGVNLINDTVNNICQIAGMEVPSGRGSDAEGRGGLTGTGINVTISGNRVVNCGYLGIEFKSSATVGANVFNNFVDTFCNVRQDGGGIYSYNSNNTPTTWAWSNVYNNIVLHGIGNNNGCASGQPKKGRGIYPDEGSNHENIYSNTIAYMASQAIHANSNTYLNFNDNILYGNTSTSLDLTRFNGAPLYRNIIATRNTFIPYTVSYFNAAIDQPTLISIQSDVQAMSGIDSNYYQFKTSTPFAAGSQYANKTNYNVTNYSLANWQGTFLQDRHSIPFASNSDSIRFEYNASSTPLTVSLGAVYTQTNGTKVSSITIPAFYSWVGVYYSNLPPVTYSMVTVATPTAGGTVSGSGTYASGATAVLTATTNAGYNFVGWSGAASGTSTTTTVFMNADKTATATFALAPVFYTLTTNSSPTTGGTTTGGGSYASGSVASLTATPNAGYYFLNWSGAASGTNPLTTVTVNANSSATATFLPKQYALTTASNPTIGGSVTGSGTYDSGQVVSVVATPASGYTFLNWSGDASGTSLSTTITMSADKSATANFQLIPPIDSFTLSTTSIPTVGGTITGGGVYESGATANLSATPSTGYTFVNWTGAASGTNPNTTVSMTSDKSATANFTPITYTLTTAVSPVASGTVSGGGTYNSGTVAAVVATPATGYNFSSWSDDASGTALSTTVAMTGNKTATANFTLIPIPDSFTVVTSSLPSLGGNVTGAGTYLSGATATLTATASTGYTFTGWTGDVTSSSNPLSVNMTANKNIIANFTYIQQPTILKINKKLKQL